MDTLPSLLTTLLLFIIVPLLFAVVAGGCHCSPPRRIPLSFIDRRYYYINHSKRRMSSNSSRPSIPPHCSTPPSIIMDTTTSPSMSQPIIHRRSSIRLSSSSLERGQETSKLLPSAVTKTKKRITPEPSNSTSSSSTNKRLKVKKEAADTQSQTTHSFEPAWWGNSISSHLQPTETDNYYPPIHTLILGTHPSITSLQKVELYAHTQNAFWYIVGDVLHFRRNAAISTATTSSPANKNKPYATYYNYLRYTNIIPYNEQLELLVSKGFALWDIIATCERKGSLDVDIRNEEPNRIREFCEGTYPSLSDDGCKVEEEEGGCNSNTKNNNSNVKCENNKYVNIQRIIIANGTTGAKFFIKYFTNWFLEGNLCVANNDMSQKAFKSILNKMINQKSAGQHQHKIEIVVLPSVSPAAASITYIQKREAWETYCYTPGLIDYNNWVKTKTKKMTSSKYQKLSFMKQENAPLDIIIASPSSHATTKMTTTMMTLPSSKKKSKSSPNKVTSLSSSSSPSTSPTKIPAIRLLSSDLELLTPENPWIDLHVSPSELRPSATLTNGQCFNWLVVDSDTPPTQSAVMLTLQEEKKVTTSAWGTHDAKEWVGPLHNRVLSIRETSTTTLVRVLQGPTEDIITDMKYYFRLEIQLLPLYKLWSTQDDRLAKIAKSIPGVRIVRQDPHECLFSFICTSNNNIPRITKILSSFRERYGTLLMDLPTRSTSSSGGYSSENDVLSTMSLYSFPTLADLENVSESDLRTLGLGYRAKFVIETRDLLQECGGTDYLMTLRSNHDATVVQEALIKFSGIGRKVADCIALFSLDQDDAIPVDVHIQHIANRDYDPSIFGEAKSITPTIYKRVGDLFRTRFTDKPGWAHSLLFCAELPSFRNVLPIDVVTEMDEWKRKEKKKAQGIKDEKKKKKNAR